MNDCQFFGVIVANVHDTKFRTMSLHRYASSVSSILPASMRFSHSGYFVYRVVSNNDKVVVFEASKRWENP